MEAGSGAGALRVQQEEQLGRGWPAAEWEQVETTTAGAMEVPLSRAGGEEPTGAGQEAEEVGDTGNRGGPSKGE